jgi:hypothetical protein
MNGLAVFPVVALGVGLVGVWGVQEKSRAAAPAPAAHTGLSFAGQWMTTHGPLTFQVEGGELKATWPGSKGTLRGRTQGHRFLGIYSDASGEGAVRLVLSAEGRAFFGSWTAPLGQRGLWYGQRRGNPGPDRPSKAAPPEAPR